MNCLISAGTDFKSSRVMTAKRTDPPFIEQNQQCFLTMIPEGGWWLPHLTEESDVCYVTSGRARA
jgi:hypothetical protein